MMMLWYMEQYPYESYATKLGAMVLAKNDREMQ